MGLGRILVGPVMVRTLKSVTEGRARSTRASEHTLCILVIAEIDTAVLKRRSGEVGLLRGYGTSELRKPHT